jgi:hypothetical protein
VKYFADIGSSTVKVYSIDGERVELAEENSLQFKYGFDSAHGIAPDRIEAFFSWFAKVAQKLGLDGANTKTAATGIWREVPAPRLEAVKSRFESEFGIEFNVISHELEGHYLKLATELDFGGKKAMIINMGGKTTEVVSFGRNGSTRTQLLKIGAADLTAAFPRVNEPFSGATIEEMTARVADAIAGESFDTDYDFAMFTGELRAETLVGYRLQPNTLFLDANHPYMESIEDFIAGARKMFFEMTYAELEALTPHNPAWWVGGRAGAVLPLAIFQKAKIEWIVPSDLNLVHGAAKDLY